MSLEQLLITLKQNKILLSIEQDQLRVRAPKGSINQAIKMALAQHKEALLERLRFEQQVAQMPLSFAQERLWFLSRLNPTSNHYNIFCQLTIADKVDAKRLEKVFEIIELRHQILTTTIAINQGTPYLVNHAPGKRKLKYYDLTQLPPRVKDKECQQITYREEQRYFDIEKGPLWSTSLIDLEEQKSILVLCLHHIVCDGLSLQILSNETETLYQALTQGDNPSLAPLSYQFVDHARWERQNFTGNHKAELTQYWVKQLQDVPRLMLPLDNPRPKVQTHNGAVSSFTLSPQTSQQLKHLCQAHNVSVFMALMTVYSVLAKRYSGQEDFCVGTPIAGRHERKLEPLIGMFVNTLAIRCQVDEQLSFIQALKPMRDTLLDAYEHQLMPFDYLVEALNVERNLSYSPIFQVMLSYFQDNDDDADVDADGMTLMDHQFVASKFDLEYAFADTDQGITAKLTYNSDLFSQASMVRQCEHFVCLVENILAQPNVPLDKIEMLSSSELQQILLEWNQTQMAYPNVQSLSWLFEQQVSQTPDHCAVIGADGQWCYQTLNQRVNQLSFYLQAKGVKSTDRVALMLSDGVDKVLAIYACLKLGAAYVPIATDCPGKRLTAILADLNPKMILADSSCHALIVANSKIQPTVFANLPLDDYPKHNPLCHSDLNSVAYIIYTSGSTGVPKGVEVLQRGVVNRILWMQQQYGLNEQDRVLQKTPYYFDVSVWEFLWPLQVGASLVTVKPGGHQEPLYLRQLIESYDVTTLHFVPSMLDIFLHALVQTQQSLPSSIRQVFCSGEALNKSSCQQFFAMQAAKPAQLHNLYGPTEASIDVSFWHCQNDEPRLTVPIGKPIANTQFYILDSERRICPVGVRGEGDLGGVGLAKGYFNQPQLTAEVFIDHAFSHPLLPQGPGRLYRSGDIAQYDSDGNVLFIRRADQQLKIRGLRIELAEIEAALLSLDWVKQAVVVSFVDHRQQTSLAAFVVSESRQASGQIETLRLALAEYLPQYMIPAQFNFCDDFPLTPSGKVDRKQLISQGISNQTQDAGNHVRPTNQTQKQLVAIWQQVLLLDEISVTANFFALGGNSLDLVKTQLLINSTFELDLGLVELFQYPNIAQLASFISASKSLPEAEQSQPQSQPQFAQGVLDVAIVGMSGRFPGASNVQQYWQNIIQAKESIRFFSDEHLDAHGVDADIRAQDNYVAAAGYLDGIDEFDADFFQYTPKEAQVTDPQLRLLLQCSFHALQDSGYRLSNDDKQVGVFVGSGRNHYVLDNILPNQAIVDAIGAQQIWFANDRDYLATTVAHKLDLRGPAYNVATACSTSLVAVHMAVKALLNFECHGALAGAVNINHYQDLGYFYTPGNVLSPDGHCRVFDFYAQGTVAGSGVAMVMLKRLEDAVLDNNHIYAVIKGSAVNNDGNDKMAYSAPSIAGQQAVIAQALAVADVDPQTIEYIEAHGTGTVVGDPIEVKALTEAFAGSALQHCALGSVKANIGHLGPVAGVAGLIKTALALEAGLLPPQRYCQETNSAIDFAKTPFYINDQLRPWHSAYGVRRAGVSSFGIGGTNVHVVLEQAPESTSKPAAVTVPKDTPTALLLSGHSQYALQQTSRDLATWLHSQAVDDQGVNLAELAYCLRHHRDFYRHRAVVLADTLSDAKHQLEHVQLIQSAAVIDNDDTPLICMMFPGQGAQAVNMTANLYHSCSQYRQLVDSCSEQLVPHLGLNMTTLLFPEPQMQHEALDLIDQTQYTQAALFVVEYALCQLLLSRGVKPDVLIGHSVGEYVAACISGVMSLADALKLVAARGRLMQGMAAGQMLAVGLTEASLVAMLPSSLSIAAINQLDACVVSGPCEAIADFSQQLHAQDIFNQSLQTSHAFHSAMMEPMLAEFTQLVAGIRLSPPRDDMAVISSLTGSVLTPQQACDPHYWAEQLRQTVRFNDALQCAINQFNCQLWIEVGYGNTLSTFANAQLKAQSVAHAGVMSLVDKPQYMPDNPVYQRHPLSVILARLWVNGVDVEFDEQQALAARYRLPLYPFQPQSFWLQEPDQNQSQTNVQQPDIAPISQWGYQPQWRCTLTPAPLMAEAQTTTEHNTTATWLIFANQSIVCRRLLADLQLKGAQVICLQSSTQATLAEADQVINPARMIEYRKLFRQLSKDNVTELKVVHFWSMTEDVTETSSYDQQYQQKQQVGFFSLLYLIQNWLNFINIGGQETSHQLDLSVVSNDCFKVLSSDEIDANKSGLIQLLKVTPQEHSNIHCSLIDVGCQSHQQLLPQPLLSEGMCAYRFGERWQQHYQPIDWQQQPTMERIKTAGVYLITGGLGHLGLAFALSLAKRYQAKLCLLSRSVYPKAEDWQSLIDDASTDSELKARLSALQIIEQHASDLLVLDADVTDLASFTAAVDTAQAQLGHIDGVIHGAGDVSHQQDLIAQLNTSRCQQVTEAKVLGACHIEQIFAQRGLDFCCLMSSVSTVLGGISMAAYAAANGFLDAFAESQTQVPFISIGWDGWHVSGSQSTTTGLGASVVPMEMDEGLAAFYHIINQAVLMPRVVVAKTDLHHRISQWSNPSLAAQNDTSARQDHLPRPALSTPYVSPRDDIDRQIAAIWTELFGIEGIGIDDDFFELGGHSLMATRMVTRFRTQFAIELPLQSLLQQTNIRRLSDEVLRYQTGQLGNEFTD